MGSLSVASSLQDPWLPVLCFWCFHSPRKFGVWATGRCGVTDFVACRLDRNCNAALESVMPCPPTVRETYPPIVS
ncbi:hypothetical protein BAUCODRAFT_170158 [Baudoinia panamericana UAMH 10762]|uniref:Uncharacterized protein n=1 Tax=Baudoinia panamericana (strain UAMH 10762) TaxID=717646 RepID=M2NLU9_BAUPA|nr:uncharacterized protein BAUCODRAFT_170158 [Baudoinia panamericana UAMH 10762]EMD00470.1 hypothetical protein BAUCODRAFT_170158 [Baudoinia panamericana UAMH 10762]